MSLGKKLFGCSVVCGISVVLMLVNKLFYKLHDSQTIKNMHLYNVRVQRA